MSNEYVEKSRETLSGNLALSLKYAWNEFCSKFKMGAKREGSALKNGSHLSPWLCNDPREYAKICFIIIELYLLSLTAFY